jgi:hypothetical protein
MSSQDPIGSTVPPERPTNPTHFGGDGLYEPKPDTSDIADTAFKVPLSEHLDGATMGSLEGEQHAEGSLWDFAKRNHVPALVAIGGIVWLLASLVRRSTEHS